MEGRLADLEVGRRLGAGSFGEVYEAFDRRRSSYIALKHLRTIAERARTLIEKNRPILHAFLDSRNDLECPRREFGTVAFPRLLLGNVDALWDFLVEKYDTAFVPGRFFEKPDHFRIGIGCDTEVLKEGLARLAMALDEQQAWR